MDKKTVQVKKKKKMKRHIFFYSVHNECIDALNTLKTAEGEEDFDAKLEYVLKYTQIAWDTSNELDWKGYRHANCNIVSSSFHSVLLQRYNIKSFNRCNLSSFLVSSYLKKRFFTIY